nr:hypothetical protein [Brevibacterium epidermidis]
MNFDPSSLVDQSVSVGFGQQPVAVRLVEPTSKSDSVRVLDELGIEGVHRNTFLNCLVGAKERDYRAQLAEKCFAHSIATTGISFLLYDVTTLLCRCFDYADFACFVPGQMVIL